MKIIFSGGGTLGSVTPLIAVWQELKKTKPDCQVLWVGTKDGPEKEFINNYGFKFKAISSGKLRRYFSWQNLLDLFLVTVGFFQSLNIIFKFKPDVIVSAGGFVSVPVVWAGWLLKIPSLIHQQDVRPGLANKLMSARAGKITVTFEKSLQDFSKEKVVLTGNAVREEIFNGSKEKAIKFFNLEPNLPIVLIIGGGTGSLTINKLVWYSLSKLTESIQIIHLTGKGKSAQFDNPRYHQYDFLTKEIKDALAASDLIISRASMSVLTEITARQKPAVLIPIPNSHQEDNAIEFAKNNAAIYLKQQDLTPQNFSDYIIDLINDSAARENLSRNIAKMMISDGRKKIAEEIIQLSK